MLIVSRLISNLICIFEIIRTIVLAIINVILKISISFHSKRFPFSGIFFIVPCIDTYRKVDLRVLSFEVPPQEILSKDSVTVAVDAVVYFRISNATISVRTFPIVISRFLPDFFR